MVGPQRQLQQLRSMLSTIRGIVLFGALVISVSGTQKSVGGDGSCVAASKSEMRDQLRSQMKVLRAQRDNGEVSETDYRVRKEQLRQLGKTGGSPSSMLPLRVKQENPIPPNFEKVTWNVIKHSFQVDSIEDPVTGCSIEKEKFASIFGTMLQDLNGQGGYEDSYMNFYFERDVVNTSQLKFISEERKGEWVDWAEELGIQPTMEEIKAGEDRKDKEKREHEEKAGGKRGSP